MTAMFRRFACTCCVFTTCLYIVLSLFRFFAFIPDDPPALSTYEGIPLGLKVPAVEALYGNFSDARNNSLDLKNGHSKESERSLDTHPLKLPPASADGASSGPGYLRSETILFSEIVVNHLKLSGNKNDAKGIQMSILSYTDFWYRVAPLVLSGGELCCTAADVQNGTCSTEHEIKRRPAISSLESLTVSKFEKPVSYKVPITDMFFLLYSNCGNTTVNQTLDVSIYLRNYFGYLPGVEASKPALYIFLLVVYVLVALGWTVLLFMYRQRLVRVHSVMTVLLLINLTEYIAWFLLYRSWNITGTSDAARIAVALVFAVIKNVLAFGLIVLVSMGWNIVRPSLDKLMKRKLIATTIGFALFDTARQLVQHFRTSYESSAILLVLFILPLCVLYGTVFFWSLTSLSTLNSQFHNGRLAERLDLFPRSWMTLVLIMAGSIAFLMCQIVMMMSNTPGHWRPEWYFTDAFPQLGLLILLLSMMSLWTPRLMKESSGRAAI